jgi:hypothetical protein
MILEFLGCAVIALIAAGAGIAIMRQVRRNRFEETRDFLELAILQSRLDAERDLRLAKSRSPFP